MGIIVAIIIFVIIWDTNIGKFIIGNFAKVVYSCIAISICLAIPIPIVDVLLAIWLVGGIWSSKIG